MEIRLRPLTVSDADPMSEMSARAFDSQNVAKLVKEHIELSLTEPRPSFGSDKPALVRVEYFAIEDPADGIALGMIGLYSMEWTNREIAYLGWFFVDPNTHGKGIGRSAVEAISAMARGLGKTSIRVEVDAADPDAIGFYEKCGFVRETVVKSYFYEDVDMQLMRLIL
ncbi:MAG: GNAT family N-acetyltransferase [Fimbriimonadaceae bacterium]|nr:GNAT family N-acetyltransferase [Fimbriimonadaceae bacterium]